jgi:hypothetical protein
MKPVKNNLHGPLPGEWAKLNGWAKFYKVHSNDGYAITFVAAVSVQYHFETYPESDWIRGRNETS